MLLGRSKLAQCVGTALFCACKLGHLLLYQVLQAVQLTGPVARVLLRVCVLLCQCLVQLSLCMVSCTGISSLIQGNVKYSKCAQEHRDCLLYSSSPALCPCHNARGSSVSMPQTLRSEACTLKLAH